MSSHSSDVFTTFPQHHEFVEAYERITDYIHRTPVFTSRLANERSGRCLFFKAENLQKTGSVKARGALNAVFKTRDRHPKLKGIVAHSSGNHGLAVAWACSKISLPSYLVVPQITSKTKKNAIKNYGGNLVEVGPTPNHRYEMVDKLLKENDYEYVPPNDHRDVIAGQGTIGLELIEQVPELDAIVVPVSGGGLSAGIAAAVKHVKPTIKVFLVCPPGKLLEECLRTGKRPWSGPPKYLDTIADGIRMQQTVPLTTPVLIRLAEKDVFEMSDDDIIEGMKFGFERMKLVVEGAAGASIAAALSDKMKAIDPSVKNIGVIVCGGNVDIDNLPW